MGNGEWGVGAIPHSPLPYLATCHLPSRATRLPALTGRLQANINLLQLSDESTTRQSHLFNGRGQQVLRQESCPQGYLSRLLLRREDRRVGLERLGQIHAVADHRRRRSGISGRDRSLARLLDRLS